MRRRRRRLKMSMMRIINREEVVIIISVHILEEDDARGVRERGMGKELGMDIDVWSGRTMIICLG